MMIYLFILFFLALLAGVTVYFFTSLKQMEFPPNVRLVIDAWNSVRDGRTEDGGEGAVRNDYGRTVGSRR